MSLHEVQDRQSTRGNIYAFGFTSLFNDMASEMAYWVLPAFLASLGAGPAQLGIIEGLAESIASLAKLFSGYLADRLPRRKPIVVSGYIVANTVKPILALATSWWHVLLIRFSDRLSKGIRGTARDVMAAESSDTSRIGSTYGFIQAMDSAGAIVGPLLAMLLIPHYGLRGIFWLATIPGFLCIAIACFGIKETRRSVSRLETKSNEQGNRVAKLPASFYFVLVAVTLFSLGNSSDMFLVLRAQNIGIPVAHAPLLGLVFNVMYTVASWPAGYLSDRFSRRIIATSGYLVFAVVYFVFAAAPSITAIWISMTGYGLFYALSDPVLKALVVETVAPEIRGRALGIYAFSTSIATLSASIIAGELWKYHGPRFPFYLSAGIAVIAAGMLMISPHKNQTAII
jgi:MFS family permease